VNGTFREIGSAFGQALLGAVAITVLITTFTTHIQNTNLPQPVKAAAVQNIRTNQGQQLPYQKSAAQLPPTMQSTIVSAQKAGAVQGVQDALVAGASLSLLGFVVLSIFLPKNMKTVRQATSSKHKKRN
jgi:hypothetical protein